MPQPDKIMALRTPEIDELDADMQKYFGIAQEKLGMVPNVLRAYSLRQERMRNFINMYNELMLSKDTVLSKLEREMIAVVVSSANRCYYCLVAHGQAVRDYSGDPQLGEMMVMNYRVAELEPRQRAMLDYAWKLTKTPFEVSEADRNTLRETGFSDEDIFDITETIGFFNLSNRMAFGLDMIPNAEYHSMSR